MNWLSKLFAPGDRRRARRHSSPPLLAFYWNGELPEPHAVPDISHNGLFVKTDDRWTSDSILRVTIQMQSEDNDKSGESITVQCKVVRTEEDGVGMAIMLAEDNKSRHPAAPGSVATRKQLKKFLEHLSTDAKPQTVIHSVPQPLHLQFPQAEQAAEQTMDSIQPAPQAIEPAPKEDK